MTGDDNFYKFARSHDKWLERLVLIEKICDKEGKEWDRVHATADLIQDLENYARINNMNYGIGGTWSLGVGLPRTNIIGHIPG